MNQSSKYFLKFLLNIIISGVTFYLGIVYVSCGVRNICGPIEIILKSVFLLFIILAIIRLSQFIVSLFKK
jgi:hypothetical protein